MITFSLLLTALLFGYMAAYSFGFAVLMFKLFPKTDARRAIRGAFPYYYLGVIALAGVCAVAALWVGWLVTLILAAICLSTIYARQVLMAQINARTDAGDTSGFKTLHGVSVVIQLIQIGLCGWALAIIA